jgi:hypothetical protein
VVASGVEKAGHLQDVTWAVGHAQLAALTALKNEMNLAMGDDDAILIERLSPELHGCILLLETSDTEVSEASNLT